MSIESLTKTPRQLGYRMPAEWEPHEATWLAWPHNPEDWPGKFASIPWLYAEIVRLLAARERVHLIVENAAAEKRVRGMLHRAGVESRSGEISTAGPPIADGRAIPARSSCATRKGRVGLTNWRFNAWAKYDDWRLDDKLPGRIEKLLGLPAWQPCPDPRRHERQTERAACVLEGGSIDVNGAGTAAHHRGVPAERGAAAQPRREPRATGAGLLTIISASTR